MKIQLAKPENIDAWMALVEQVRDAFPGLETAEAMTEMLRLELKNSAILLVTHQSVLVRHADQVLQMKDFYVNTRKKRLCPVSQI